MHCELREYAEFYTTLQFLERSYVKEGPSRNFPLRVYCLYSDCLDWKTHVDIVVEDDLCQPFSQNGFTPNSF